MFEKYKWIQWIALLKCLTNKKVTSKVRILKNMKAKEAIYIEVIRNWIFVIKGDIND